MSDKNLKTLEIEANEDTPYMLLDSEKLFCKIEGPSYPENAIGTFTPVVNWLKSLGNVFSNTLVLEFSFTILSSASHKVIFKILSQLNMLYDRGNKIKIIWKYDKQDDDMIESGEDFQSAIDIPFLFLEK